MKPTKVSEAEQYLKAGMFAEAVDAYQFECKQNPHDAKNWNSLGVAYYRLDKYPEALEAYKTAFKLRPMHQVIVYNIEAVIRDMYQPDFEKISQTFKDTLIDLLDLP